jgi:hypothetical protein
MSKIEEVYKGCREFDRERLSRQVYRWASNKDRSDMVFELWDFSRRFLGWHFTLDDFAHFVYCSSKCGEPRTLPVRNLSFTDESDIQILELYRRLGERVVASCYPVLDTSNVLNNLYHLAENYSQEEEELTLDQEDNEEFWEE